MSTPTNEQQEYWNRVGGERWVTYQEALDEMVRPFGKAALDRLAPSVGEHVLDVGCGCGETVLELAARVGSAGSVTGIDISAPMLTRARERAPSATLLEGDAATFSFARKFDALYSRFGIMFFADPAPAFRHLAGALVPGGRVAFSCWRAPADNPWYTLAMNAARAALPEVELPWQDDAGPGPFSFADRQRIQQVLSDAGFRAIEIAPFDAEVVYSRSGLASAVQFALTVGPAARVVKEASPEQRARVAEAVSRALAPHLRGEELIVQGATWTVFATT